MRKNGFILIGLVGAAMTLSGSPGYLPKVGPVALHFRTAVSTTPAQRAASLPPLIIPNPAATLTPEVETAPEVASETAATNAGPARLDHSPVVIEVPAGSTTNFAGQLIGSAMDTNAVISPQVFLRFFTPSKSGAATEAIVVPPTDFNPAQPATAPPSRATFTQPTP